MEEYTVSRLSALIKRSVEQNFSGIHLKAEVSALKIPSSGHLYFTLKDADAVIDAVCWKGVAQKQKIKLEDGMEIRCLGRVTTYQLHSKYQFMVEEFELAGIGELLKLLEERKKKLAAEGLFDASRKKPLPTIPKLIGIITSPTGAVIKDMLHRIGQRFPREILLWPVLVQGSEAARQIVDAIGGMNSLPSEKRPDLLIVARGGGSFEDLMPFNDESVVRAVAESKIPIISAVGHETDTTLIDYAADLRAPTPTAAAEFAVPERMALRANVAKIFSQLTLLISNNLEKKKLFIRSNKILNVESIIFERVQRVDYVSDKIVATIRNKISQKSISLAKITIPRPMVQKNVEGIFQKLAFLFIAQFENAKNLLALAASGIESNSYANILKKGFAFVESHDSLPITSAKEAEKRPDFNLIFADGRLQVCPKTLQRNLFAD
ncbi:MAG: exodeoxyribonuclease VII large subunit [Holosporaceae bacterium]|jgi:exodeoxyribonuclease VII large subunit|nr:exodeoxyribonuclease VII large subunit [Holosporaceae bacterium]